MFKLTAILCAAMFAVLLIAGEDRGQLRPGLANAPVVAEIPTAASVVVAAAPAPAASADVAPVATPVSVAAATTPATEDAIEATVFSLANYADDAGQAAPTPAPAADTSSALAYVDAESVNVREGPGTENPVLARLARGEAVTIVSTDNTGWARIRIEGDGVEGFMSMDYLSATAP